VANALVVILEPRNGLFDQIANAVVIFHQIQPVDFAGRQVAFARPATIAGSERSIGEAGLSLPDEACTIDIESSTVIDCRPLACRSSSVRPRHGRIKVSFAVRDASG
jgi:hypothetical protein